MIRVRFKRFWILLLFGVGFVVCASADDRAIGSDQSDPSSPEHIRVSLKHRRYKPLRDNQTSSSSSHERAASPTDPHVIYEHPHDHHPHDFHGDNIPHPDKLSRSGISLQKAPPDLQFGLAFTVPFVSLSTEKLLNGVAGKSNFDSSGVSSLLKLNFSGLLLAAVVGLIAAAGIFLPSFLSPGGVPPPWLDNIIPHFTDSQYNDYENGWSKPNGPWGKEYSARRAARGDQHPLASIGTTVFKMIDSFKSGVSKLEKCVVERVCEEQANGNTSKLSQLVKELVDRNELIQDVGFVKVLKRIVVERDAGVCAKISGAGSCDGFKDVEETVLGVVEQLRGKKKSD